MPDDAWIGAWSPGFNDPSVMGFVITAAYLWVGWMCRNLARAPVEPGPVAVRVVSGARQISRSAASNASALERSYFGALGWGLFTLGINKQLDLQTALYQLARAIAQSFELQSLRFALVIGFVTVLGVILSLLAWLLWIVARRLGRPARIAMGGCLALLLFVLVRAFESFVEGSLVQVIVFDSGLIEAAALAWIAFGVRLQRRRSPARSTGA